MKIINATSEWWPQERLSSHIARVGRICYKSKGKEPSADMTDEEREAFIQKRDEDRCKSFWKSGHKSMYRHGSVYFYVSNDKALPNKIWAWLSASPYIDYMATGHKVWISTNMHFLSEHPHVKDILEPFYADEEHYIQSALRAKYTDALYLLRMTFAVTTQISTSRELNRTSPNAIAEQSTRYCNLDKKGGVQIVKPHWYDSGALWQRFLFNASCRMSELAYHLLLKTNMKPENARGVLPLDTYTVVAYTYTIADWSKIIDLRYHGTTGTPHPNAREAVGHIRNAIIERLKQYIPEFTL